MDSSVFPDLIFQKISFHLFSYCSVFILHFLIISIIIVISLNCKMYTSTQSNSETRNSFMAAKSYKESFSTPSYAQPTISFTKHQKAEHRNKKSGINSPVKSVRLRKAVARHDDRAFCSISAADISNNQCSSNQKLKFPSNNFEIFQDPPKFINKAKSGFEKILVSGYDNYYTIDENKENSSPIKTKELYFREPMLKKNQKASSELNYDSIANHDDKPSICTVSNYRKPLQVRYQKSFDSLNLLLDSGDSLISKFQKQETSEDNSSGLPREYLKSFTKDNQYISATEWDSSIDIVEFYCQSLFDVKRKEIQELKNCKKDLENENKRLNNFINDLKEQLRNSNRILDPENTNTEIYKISNNSLRRPNSTSSNSNSGAIVKTTNSNTVSNVISTNPKGFEKDLSHQKFNLEDGSELRSEEELRD